MICYIERQKKCLAVKILHSFLVFTFTITLIIPPNSVQAQSLSALPVPGTLISLSPAFNPVLIKGLKVHPENPLKFDFIVDQGDENLSESDLKKETTRLVKYFLASLTTPEKDLWVNLSPYEKDRIVEESFGTTEMGRDLLAQDYILKQLTASLIYPENELGKKFWDKVKRQAKEQYGAEEVPMSTFNKVWIVPERAVVYESGEVAFVADSYLKVMLEEDYLALRANEGHNPQTGKLDNQSEIRDTKYDLASSEQRKADRKENLTANRSTLSAEIIREIILPEIEKEVNEGKNFAQLRQIYNSLILATWFKQNLKESLLGQVYVDKGKVAGVEIADRNEKQKIYERYLEAYKRGVYNYIKEEKAGDNGGLIPRKYFSGGTTFLGLGAMALVATFGPETFAQMSPAAQENIDKVAHSATLATTILGEAETDVALSSQIPLGEENDAALLIDGEDSQKSLEAVPVIVTAKLLRGDLSELRSKDDQPIDFSRVFSVNIINNNAGQKEMTVALKQDDPAADLVSHLRQAGVRSGDEIILGLSADPAMPVHFSFTETPQKIELLRQNIYRLMNLIYTPDERAFFDEAAEKIGELLPEEFAALLDLRNDMGVAIDADIYRKLATTKIQVGEVEVPLLGSALGRNRGKLKNGTVFEAIITEVLSFYSQAVALGFDVINALTGYPFDQFGTEEQKERFLYPMIEPKEGEDMELSAFAITESGAGSSSLAGMTSRAIEIDPDPVTGKRRWLVKGGKQYITNGTKANQVIFLAITDENAHKQNPAKGVSYFVVPIERLNANAQKKLEEERAGLPDQVNGKVVKKWATRVPHRTLSTHRGSGTAWINADDVILTEDDILGGINGLDKGAPMYFKILDAGRISISSISMGGLSRLLTDMLNRAEKLVSGFGFKSVLAEWEESIFSLLAHTYGDRLRLVDTARKKDGQESYNLQAAMIKLLGGEDQNRHNILAMGLFGREAVRPGLRNRDYRNAKLETIGEGTSEIMRYIVGRQQLLREAQKKEADRRGITSENEIKKIKLSYEEAVKLLLGYDDIIPPNIHGPVRELIEWYGQRTRSGASADTIRIFQERVQIVIADLITAGRRLQLTEETFKHHKVLQGVVEQRLLNILTRELEELSEDVLDEIRQILDRDFEVVDYEGPGKTNVKVKVPVPRALRLPALELDKDDLETVAAVKDSIQTIIDEQVTPYLDQSGSHESGILEEVVQRTLATLARESFIGTTLPESFDGLGSDPKVAVAVQAVILETLAESNLSVAAAVLEQEKVLAALLPFANPKDSNDRIGSLIEAVKSGNKKGALVLFSDQNTPLVYRQDGLNDFRISGTASLVPAGSDADIFIVLAANNNGDPRVFIVEKDKTISTQRVEGTLGVEGVGFADVIFKRASSVPLQLDLSASSELKDIQVVETVVKDVGAVEGRGLKSMAIGNGRQVVARAQEHAMHRLQGPPGDQKPNLYHAAVHRMIERIIGRIETIAGLDVHKPQEMEKLLLYMTLNADDAVQILGGEGLDREERIVNWAWRDTASLFALGMSNLRLRNEINQKHMDLLLNAFQALLARGGRDHQGDLAMSVQEVKKNFLEIHEQISESFSEYGGLSEESKKAIAELPDLVAMADVLRLLSDVRWSYRVVYNSGLLPQKHKLILEKLGALIQAIQTIDSAASEKNVLNIEDAALVAEEVERVLELVQDAQKIILAGSGESLLEAAYVKWNLEVLKDNLEKFLEAYNREPGFVPLPLVNAVKSSAQFFAGPGALGTIVPSTEGEDEYLIPAMNNHQGFKFSDVRRLREALEKLATSIDTAMVRIGSVPMTLEEAKRKYLAIHSQIRQNFTQGPSELDQKMAAGLKRFTALETIAGLLELIRESYNTVYEVSSPKQRAILDQFDQLVQDIRVDAAMTVPALEINLTAQKRRILKGLREIVNVYPAFRSHLARLEQEGKFIGLIHLRDEIGQLSRLVREQLQRKKSKKDKELLINFQQQLMGIDELAAAALNPTGKESVQTRAESPLDKPLSLLEKKIRQVDSLKVILEKTIREEKLPVRQLAQYYLRILNALSKFIVEARESRLVPGEKLTYHKAIAILDRLNFILFTNPKPYSKEIRAYLARKERIIDQFPKKETTREIFKQIEELTFLLLDILLEALPKGAVMPYTGLQNTLRQSDPALLTLPEDNGADAAMRASERKEALLELADGFTGAIDPKELFNLAQESIERYRNPKTGFLDFMKDWEEAIKIQARRIIEQQIIDGFNREFQDVNQKKVYEELISVPEYENTPLSVFLKDWRHLRTRSRQVAVSSPSLVESAGKEFPSTDSYLAPKRDELLSQLQNLVKTYPVLNDFLEQIQETEFKGKVHLRSYLSRLLSTVDVELEKGPSQKLDSFRESLLTMYEEVVRDLTPVAKESSSAVPDSLNDILTELEELIRKLRKKNIVEDLFTDGREGQIRGYYLRLLDRLPLIISRIRGLKKIQDQLAFYSQINPLIQNFNTVLFLDSSPNVRLHFSPYISRKQRLIGLDASGTVEEFFKKNEQLLVVLLKLLEEAAKGKQLVVPYTSLRSHIEEDRLQLDAQQNIMEQKGRDAAMTATLAWEILADNKLTNRRKSESHYDAELQWKEGAAIRTLEIRPAVMIFRHSTDAKDLYFQDSEVQVGREFIEFTLHINDGKDQVVPRIFRFEAKDPKKGLWSEGGFDIVYQAIYGSSRDDTRRIALAVDEQNPEMSELIDQFNQWYSKTVLDRGTLNPDPLPVYFVPRSKTQTGYYEIVKDLRLGFEQDRIAQLNDSIVTVEAVKDLVQKIRGSTYTLNTETGRAAHRALGRGLAPGSREGRPEVKEGLLQYEKRTYGFGPTREDIELGWKTERWQRDWYVLITQQRFWELMADLAEKDVELARRVIQEATEERSSPLDFEEEEKEDRAMTVKSIAVVGAGKMGTPIAYVAAAIGGTEVGIMDISAEQLVASQEKTRKLVEDGVSRDKVRGTVDEVLGRVKQFQGNIPAEALEGREIIIEAATENLKIKQEIFRTLDERASPNTILATNTSSINIDDLAAVTRHPERVIGLHYFDPVEGNPLIEIIPGSKTSPEMVEKAIALVRQMGRMPLVVKNVPGFAINRIFIPLFNEAIRIRQEEFANYSTIDAAIEELVGGMGPFRYTTDVNDTAIPTQLHALPAMVEGLNNKYYEAPQLLRERYAIYEASEGHTRWPIRAPGETEIDRSKFKEIQERILGAILTMAGYIIDEEIVSRPQDLDMGTSGRFGLKWWSGGPFTMMNTLGIKESIRLVDNYRTLMKSKYGYDLPRPKSLDALAEENAKWPSEYVYTTVDRGVAEIRIDKPEIKNALDPAVVEQLKQAVVAANANSAVNSIILHVNIPGADLNYFKLRMIRDQIEEIMEFTRNGLNSLDSIRQSKKPVIAKIAGVAIGGGFEVAQYAQVILMDPTARVQLPETGLGIYPGLGGTQLVMRRIEKNLLAMGYSPQEVRRTARSRAKQMILGNARVKGEDAYIFGLTDLPAELTEDFETRLKQANGKLTDAMLERPRANYGDISHLQLNLDWAYQANRVDIIRQRLNDLLVSDGYDEPERVVIRRHLRVFENNSPLAMEKANDIINRGAELSEQEAMELEFAFIAEMFQNPATFRRIVGQKKLFTSLKYLVVATDELLAGDVSELTAQGLDPARVSQMMFTDRKRNVERMTISFPSIFDLEEDISVYLKKGEVRAGDVLEFKMHEEPTINDPAMIVVEQTLLDLPQGDEILFAGILAQNRKEGDPVGANAWNFLMEMAHGENMRDGLSSDEKAAQQLLAAAFSDVKTLFSGIYGDIFFNPDIRLVGRHIQSGELSVPLRPWLIAVLSAWKSLPESTKEFIKNIDEKPEQYPGVSTRDLLLFKAELDKTLRGNLYKTFTESEDLQERLAAAISLKTIPRYSNHPEVIRFFLDMIDGNIPDALIKDRILVAAVQRDNASIGFLVKAMQGRIPTVTLQDRRLAAYALYNSDTKYLISEGISEQARQMLVEAVPQSNLTKQLEDRQRKGGNHQEQLQDPAALTVPQEQIGKETVAPTGGVDWTKLQIKRNGRGVPLPMNMQPVGNINVKGFEPIIIQFAPVQNLRLLLGLNSEDSLPSDRAKGDEKGRERISAVISERVREVAQVSK